MSDRDQKQVTEAIAWLSRWCSTSPELEAARQRVEQILGAESYRQIADTCIAYGREQEKNEVLALTSA